MPKYNAIRVCSQWWASLEREERKKQLLSANKNARKICIPEYLRKKKDINEYLLNDRRPHHRLYMLKHEVTLRKRLDQLYFHRFGEKREKDSQLCIFPSSPLGIFFFSMTDTKWVDWREEISPHKFTHENERQKNSSTDFFAWPIWEERRINNQFCSLCFFLLQKMLRSWKLRNLVLSQLGYRCIMQLCLCFFFDVYHRQDRNRR